MTIRQSPLFRRAVQSPDLGEVLHVHEFDPSPAIRGVNVPVFIASCYSDRSRTLGEDYGSFILLRHNSYLLSFIHGLGAAWLAHIHFDLDLYPFSTGFVRKFVSEQLHILSPSQIARTLFLESVMCFEPAWRELVALREDKEELRRASNCLSNITSDLILHHELGHIATIDDRFSAFYSAAIETYFQDTDLSGLSAASLKRLRAESEADLFGICCCIASYAPRMTDLHLRSYLTFAARAVTSMNVLSLMTDDLQNQNVDARHPVQDLDQSFLIWAHREAMMVGFVQNFVAADERIATAKQDVLLDLRDADILFSSINAGDTVTEPIDEHSRRFALLVSEGFENQDGFQRVIENVRQSWVLKRTDD